MSESVVREKPRLQQLDILRGIAILLVLGRHAPIHPLKSGHLLPISGAWARFGWTGVDLFFVLSGFLIGGLLFNELRTRGSLDVRRFLIRRGLKIWPSYFVYIAFVSALLFYQTHGQVVSVFHQMLPNILQVQNYFGTPRLHTWSLAVEEHFYLVLPFVLLLAIPRHSNLAGKSHITPTAVPAIALAVMLLCTFWRCYLAFVHPPWSGEVLLFPTHLRIDSLFFGVLLAYLFHFKRQELELFVVKRRIGLLLLGFALVCPMIVLRVKDVMFVPSLGVTMLYLGYGCILLAMIFTPLGTGFLGRLLGGPAGRVLAAIGIFSYSIYLWHIELSFGLIPLVNHGFLGNLSPELRWLSIMAIYVPGSLLVGIVMTYLVEKPTLALRNHLFPSRADALAERAPVSTDPRRNNVSDLAHMTLDLTQGKEKTELIH